MPARAVTDSDERFSKAVSWHTFLATYLPALLLSTGLGIALPAIPKLASSFGVSFGIASGVITAYLIGVLVAAVPSGWLVDRFGRRPVLIAGPILAAAAAFAIAGSQSFAVLLALRFAGGVANQFWLTSRLSLISHTAAANERGRQISWMFGMDNVGRLVGPLIGGFVAAAYGPRATFVAYGALALVALIPALVFGERGRDGHDSRRTERSTMSVREIVVPLAGYFAIALFAGLARGPIFADLLHLYAAYQYKLTPTQIGYLATAASAIALPLSFFAGWLLDRFGRKVVMVPSFGGCAVAMAALAVSAYLQLDLTWYVTLFLLGVAIQSLTGGSIQTVGADVAPPAARGMFLGLWMFVGQVGVVTGPLVFAYLADAVNYGSAFVFIAAAAMVVTGLLVWLVPGATRSAAER